MVYGVGLGPQPAEGGFEISEKYLTSDLFQEL